MYNIYHHTSTPARNTNKPFTIHQLKTEHHTNTHHTPQPSTPIERAGSDIWEGEERTEDRLGEYRSEEDRTEEYK